MILLRYLILVSSVAVMVVNAVAADVNETLLFTNATAEEIYVELSIDDASGWFHYDLYVPAGASSGADFWAVDPYAPYIACAFGEVTGDFYGCQEGGIADYVNTVNFNETGIPYRTEPSGDPAEWFVFANPNHSTDYLAIGISGHADGSAGCFVGVLGGD